MDRLVELFFGALDAPWKYVAGIVAVLLIVLKSLDEFHRSWVNLRLGQAQLERDKLRLEILKLYMELKQLAQQQQLPEIELELGKIVVPAIVAPPPAVSPTPPSTLPARRGVVRRFLAVYPRVGWALMWIAQILSGYFVVLFAIMTVVFPFIGWNDETIGPTMSIIGTIVYAAFAWPSYKGFEAARSVRRELAQLLRGRTGDVPQTAAAQS